MNRHDGFDLLPAFPDMPEDCRSRLRTAVRSVREEEPMKRKFPAALLIAVLLILMTTIAIAEGWNVLSFLGLHPDSSVQPLVQPVSASSSVDNCTIRIDSAVTDGEFLAFDWTVGNTRPETPIYLWVENFTANGEPISTDGTDDFDYQWLPGWYDNTVWQDGEWIRLPDDLSGDTLRVEMIIGVYTPERPLFLMDEFDPLLAREKLDAGYYVLAEGEGLIIDDPVDGLIHAHLAKVDETNGAGLSRSELEISFALDLKAARSSVQSRSLPEPAAADAAVLSLSHALVSPLQTHLIATFTPKNADYETIVRWAERGSFVLTDADGNELALYGMCATPMREVTVCEASDKTWYMQLDCILIEVNEHMPDEIVLSFITEDGFSLSLPVPLT